MNRRHANNCHYHLSDLKASQSKWSTMLNDWISNSNEYSFANTRKTVLAQVHTERNIQIWIVMTSLITKFSFTSISTPNHLNLHQLMQQFNRNGIRTEKSSWPVKDVWLKHHHSMDNSNLFEKYNNEFRWKDLVPSNNLKVNSLIHFQQHMRFLSICSNDSMCKL